MTMHQNRGQATRIFIYVLTLVVVALVLLFGYRAISAITSTGEKATLIKFKTEFTNTVEEGSSFGRIAVRDFAISSEYTQLCLAGIGAAEGAFTHPLVRDAIRSGTDNNVFLVTEATVEPFKVDILQVDGGGGCFPIQSGRIKMRFEGKGDRTAVSFTAG